jgi:hypothetical protein
MASVVQIVINGIDRSDKAFAQSKSNLIALEKVAKIAATSFALLAASISTQAAKAMVELTRESINTADEMGKLAQKTGTTVEDLSRLSYAAELSEVDTNQLRVAIKFLSDELVKTGRSSANVLDEILKISDEFAGMAHGAGKTTLAVKLFGKSGQDLIPLLNQGSEAIRKQMLEAESLGLVIGPQFSANADAFNDNLTRLKASGRGLGLVLAEQALPSLIGISDQLVKMASNGGAIRFFDGLKDAATAFIPGGVTARLLLNQLANQLPKSDAALGGGSGTGSPTDPEHVEKAIQLHRQIIQEAMHGVAQLRGAENLAHQKRLDEIEKLQISEEQKLQLREDAESVHLQKLAEMRRTGAEARAALDQSMREGDFVAYQAHLANLHGADLAALEGRKQFLQVYHDIWMESHRTMFSYVASATQTIYGGLSNAITSVITGASTAKEAFKQLGNQMVQMVVQFMAQRLVAFALEKTLSAAGLALSKVAATSALATAAALSGANAAAATGAAIASYGTALAFGPAVGPMIAANAALGSSIALAAGSIGGVAHGGLDYVPRESTFLLDRGERVVSPEQNQDLTEFLSRGGGGSQHITLEIDGHIFAEYIYQATRDGRMRIHSNSIV